MTQFLSAAAQFRSKYGISQKYGNSLFAAIEGSFSYFIHEIFDEREQIFKSVYPDSAEKLLEKIIGDDAYYKVSKYLITHQSSRYNFPQTLEILQLLANAESDYDKFPDWIKKLQKPEADYTQDNLKDDINKHVKGIITDELEAIKCKKMPIESKRNGYIAAGAAAMLVPMLQVMYSSYRYEDFEKHPEKYMTPAHMCLMIAGTFIVAISSQYYIGKSHRVSLADGDWKHPLPDEPAESKGRGR